ncbi:hypothetical protein M407DRAFT_23051 [Tulasnella calospora MUT 4182]|uniref:Uncharacterized protein n=1 Tax=Tulasnella calospora MUT 4182 TaxID=1051891 RepID=A0A0C3QKA2_9AGAM|nr:hypothetical protein M407DRAFT_23051 [Tulasnella calospora MUT 4182]
MSYLQRYKALTAESPSQTKTEVLNSISNALPMTIDKSQREDLVKALLSDLAVSKGGVIGSDETLPALVALKTLGRDPSGSTIIVQKEHLEVLHTFAKSKATENSKEALRCVANALLLIEAGRGTWLSIGGGETCLDIMKRETAPDYVFLGARILFVATTQQSDFIVKAVTSLGAVDIVATKLDSLLGLMRAGRPMSKEAMIDTLKFAFNLLLQYPRMMQAKAKEGQDDPANKPVLGDLWDDRFTPFVPILLHLFNSLPQTTSSPLAPPLTHVIHALLSVPVGPFAEQWFSTSATSTPTSTKSETAFSKVRQRLSPTSPPSGTLPLPNAPKDALRRGYDLLDATLATFTPEDPDDKSVRAKCREMDVSLDDVAPPLALLMARMVREDDEARRRMKQWILPSDLDRSTPLEKKSNFLGRCLRLMTSVYFPRLKDSVGEMLFALCNSDPNAMAAQLGYGNCAGFLFNKGIITPPTASSEADIPSDPDINPITGAKADESPNDVLAGMSEEEKEREAEKLFVLFDRLEKMGMVVNPVRKAQQEGKLEELP